MKRLTALILAVVMLLACVSCNKTEKTPTPTVTEVITMTPVTTTETGVPATGTAQETVVPTTEPTAKPTTEPTAKPTTEPTAKPTTEPTTEPTATPAVTPEPTTVVTPTPVVTEKPPVTPTPTVVTPSEYGMPELGKAIKMSVVQVNLNKVLYFAGKLTDNTFYLATTENVAESPDVFVESKSGGGYNIYFMDGTAKKYITISQNDTHFNATISDTAGVKWEFIPEAGTFKALVGEEEYYIGCYNTYDTISASKTSYITGDNASKVDVSQFPVHYTTKSTVPVITEKPVVTPTPEPTPTPVVTEKPKPTPTPVVTEKPVVTPTPTEDVPSIYDMPELGKAIKMAVIQANLNKTLYFAGKLTDNTYYLATTENVEESPDVFVESKSGGGYNIYFMDGSTKKYITITQSGTHFNAAISDTAGVKWEFLPEAGTFKALVGEEDYYIGCYNTFNTMSASKTSYITGDNASKVDVSQFPAHYATKITTPAVTEKPVVTPTPEVTPTPAKTEEAPSGMPEVGKAYKLSVDHKGALKVIYFNGSLDSKGYYLDTTENAAEAPDVYIESISGGYAMYFTSNGAKKYICATTTTGSDGTSHVNAAISSTADCVWRYYGEAETFITTVDGTDYYLGCYGRYTTVSASNTSYITGANAENVDVSQYPARLTVYDPSAVVTPVPTQEPPKTVVIGELNFTNNFQPANYYTGIEDLSGNELKLELRSIISVTKKTETYDALRTDLALSDAGDTPGTIRLIYTQTDVKAAWDGGATWNREHIWPQSKGWFKTSGAGADIHHIRPESPSENTSRGNKSYGPSNTTLYYCPPDSAKGDVARILFYMLTRYSESDSYSITSVAYSMDMLLEWNDLDPVDSYEITRNNVGYSIQGNRNPFIDCPDLADYIWGK